jgi:hypothetical protein
VHLARQGPAFGFQHRIAGRGILLEKIFHPLKTSIYYYKIKTKEPYMDILKKAE